MDENDELLQVRKNEKMGKDNRNSCIFPTGLISEGKASELKYLKAHDARYQLL